MERLPSRAQFADLDALTGSDDLASSLDPDDVAILLFTSGTTGEPKAAVLRHKHVTSYVITTVEFMGAGDDDAALVSVPPYHRRHPRPWSRVRSRAAGSSTSAFTLEDWVATARDEAVTQAMVVRTMLGRILDVLEKEGETLPSSATSPMAVVACRRRSSSGHSACSPTWSS